jgi:SAM-dependent methyltransferase
MTQPSALRQSSSPHDHAHDHGAHHHDEAGLADLLDLDAELLAPLLDEVSEWAAQHAPETVRTIVDVGAGTGTASLALAQRFARAEVVAVDRSAMMLHRLAEAATARGLEDRLRAVQCDLDAGWPPVLAADIAWASSSLHEIADPDRVLRDIYAALSPGGLLVVVEMDGLPRFLPDDLGLGRPGLEPRCHEALAREGWNQHPDWRPHLKSASFDVLTQRTFALDAEPAPPATGPYAHAFLRRVRAALDGQLAPDDLDVLDHLVADDGPHALLHRADLALHARRTAWAAHRP